MAHQSFERLEGIATVRLSGMSAEEAMELADVLQRANYRVEVANAGAGAMHGRADVALAAIPADTGDDSLSGWGEEAARHGIAVVALIPASRPDLIDRAVAAGATEVLLTPVNAAEALARVRKVARLAALRAEAERLRAREQELPPVPPMGGN